jgi:polyisoprenoid-binding protein YceI
MKPFAIPAILSALLAALPGPSCGQTPGTYVIDSGASRIEIHVFRAGVLGGLGDDHVIVLHRFSGRADSSNGKLWTVSVVGEAGSLQVTDPRASDSTRRKVQQTMLGPTQLDAARYPKIDLRSQRLVPGNREGNWLMTTDLTVHGVTRRLELPLSCNQNGERLHVSGKATLRLRDFDIRPIRLALGAVQVSNEFELIYDVDLRRESGQ